MQTYSGGYRSWPDRPLGHGGAASCAVDSQDRCAAQHGNPGNSGSQRISPWRRGTRRPQRGRHCCHPGNRARPRRRWLGPAHAGDGWLLTVVVEDEVGPRVPERSLAVEGEQAIDLGTFYSQFIRPGRGTASVIAEVENAAAQARMARLFDAIEKNRLHPDRGPLAAK